MSKSTAYDDPLSNSEVSDHLYRLNDQTSSTTSLQTTTTLPPYSASDNTLYPRDEKNPFQALDDTTSTYSREDPDKIDRLFHVDKTFQINATGKAHFSLPVSDKQLEIGIDEFIGASKEKAHVQERYRSVRLERRKGNNTLFLSTPDGTSVPVAETTYQFGPGKPPVLKLFNLSAASTVAGEDVSEPPSEEFTINSVSFRNRTATFDSPRFGSFEWRYASKAEKKAFSSLYPSSTTQVPDNLLILQKIIVSSSSVTSKNEREVVEVARLIRNEETRTERSKRREGNGGRLEIDYETFVQGDIVGGLEAVGQRGQNEIEALVLGSCLVMLKKEIDRLRAVQASVLGGAAGVW